MSIGEIQAYCYMVQRGKPAAMVPIQERHLEKAIAFIVKEFGVAPAHPKKRTLRF